MKQVVYAGKIEKGKLVKCKLDSKFYVKEHIKALRRYSEAVPCIEIGTIMYPDGGANVPGVHS